MRRPGTHKTCDCARCQLHTIGSALALRVETTGIDEYAMAAANIAQAQYWLSAAQQLENDVTRELCKQAQLN
jgi:hypothetical protein